MMFPGRKRLEQENAALRKQLKETIERPSWEVTSARRDAALLEQLWERHSKVRVTIKPGFGASGRNDIIACESCNRYWPCPDAQLLLRRGQVEPDASATWQPLQLQRVEPKRDVS